MAIGFRKLSAVCAAMVALVGFGSGTAKAFSAAQQKSNVTQNAPLVLEHGAVSGTIELAEHYSHSSHASHHSHYSSRY